ncbi:protein neprosin-like, partial [Bidens hawaiensis]|uniref:protein neprosin-like n=1 Tax=Bidens hawaiensis TaxID=980011 RepID=UPI0040499856
YAHAQTGQGVYYGAQATFSLWNPKVQEQNEFSLSQLWVTGGSFPDLDTIEAGWHVDPEIYDGDTNTRLFIYWTNDGYQTAGCYNLKCPGFVQTNNEIAIGGSLSPTSQVDGSQYEITILIWKDTKQGVWWMQLNGKEVGYWPASLYSYLSESASALDFGGEVINKGIGGQHTSTQMGSGNFPQDGAGKASYIKDIQSIDKSNTLTPLKDLTPMTSPSASCYDIVKNDNDNQFFFGGPGRNQNCP